MLVWWEVRRLLTWAILRQEIHLQELHLALDHPVLQVPSVQFLHQL
jgi:hypothetical protein